MTLLEIYEILLDNFGRQNWWPADSEFEMIVGAILTQSTSWSNVEKAIGGLKAEGLLTPEGIMNIDRVTLREKIRPAGYFNAKADKLKAFVEFLYNEYGGDLMLFLSRPLPGLREQLLSIHGVGPETADSIILYASGKPSFVVDAYTRRIFSRIGLVDEGVDYGGLKSFFEENLPRDVGLYNEYHALLVEFGKNYCRKKPVCLKCPLTGFCSFSGE